MTTKNQDQRPTDLGRWAEIVLVTVVLLAAWPALLLAVVARLCIKRANHPQWLWIGAVCLGLAGAIFLYLRADIYPLFRVELSDVVPLFLHFNREHDIEEGDYDDVWPTRLPTSTIRYTNVPAQQGIMKQQPRKRVVNVYDIPSNIPPRSGRTMVQDYALPLGQPIQHPTSVQQSQQTGLHVHGMLLVGIGMIAMLALWLVGNLAMHWWNTTTGDWQYGRPRTFQIDARVGHNDASTPSHFIAINLNRHVMIIEFPGGDPHQGQRLYRADAVR